MKTTIKKGIITILTALSCASALAGSVTGSEKATAAISSSCTVSATDINFGNVQFGVVMNATSTLSILCSANVGYTIGMTYGNPDPASPHFGGKPQDGMLVGAVSGDLIDYGIFTSVQQSQTGYAWGLQGPVTGTGTGAIQTITAYGGLLTGYSGHSKYPTPDHYSDFVTVSLSY